VRFVETRLPHAFVVEPERLEDERGFFARTWCRKEFETRGLNSRLVQCSISYNAERGTLRGMHHQASPHAEAKLVRCTMGAIYDVIIDLRPDSPTFKQWLAVTLTARNRTMLYVPEGCSHGFLTLADNTEVFYQMSAFFAPESAVGIRWNDPMFNIAWPETVTRISDRDRQWADFQG
jgi:dTDP-4-dehydrorhamnose 3,5-epimerase